MMVSQVVETILVVVSTIDDTTRKETVMATILITVPRCFNAPVSALYKKLPHYLGLQRQSKNQ